MAIDPPVPTDPEQEKFKGRLALWLDAKDIAFLADEWRRIPPDQIDDEASRTWARLAFRAMACLHKAGIDHKPTFPAENQKFIKGPEPAAGDRAATEDLASPSSQSHLPPDTAERGRNQWLQLLDEAALTQLLGDLISTVSEDCYCARWYEGTQYIVPALCSRAAKTGKAQPWAHGELGVALAELLLTIANKLGHWANLNEQATGYIPFDPWPTPTQHEQEIDYWRKM